MGEGVAIDAQKSAITAGNFRVIIDYQCSGLAGIALVSAVIGGYVLSLRSRLWVGRALLLIPLAAALSWLINGFRIAPLVRIAAHGSPDLAINGFHSYAGWRAFCVLSAPMLFAAENIAWIHRDGGPEPMAIPLLNDPVAAQIVPFIVLLASSLFASAAFTEPEAGYPLRATLMAVVLFAFRKAHAIEFRRVNAGPVLAGVCVALIWLSLQLHFIAHSEPCT